VPRARSPANNSQHLAHWETIGTAEPEPDRSLAVVWLLTARCVGTNDDWKQNQAQIEPTGAGPRHDREAALVEDLPAGSYTAIVHGKDGTVGVALVEAFHLR
jgi:hypothetical protein